MTACRNSLLPALLAGLLLAGPAGAASDPVHPLTGLTRGGTTGALHPLTGHARSGLRDPMLVSALAPQSGENGVIGAITSHSGGLPDDAWRGTSPDAIPSLLAALKVAPDSPTQQALARIILLSAAPEVSSQPVLKARMDALVRLGWLDDAADLSRAIPDSQLSEPLAEEAAAALLRAGPAEAACLDVRAGAQRTPSAEWQAALAGCELQLGRRDAAQQALAAAQGLDGTTLALGQAVLSGAPGAVSLPSRPGIGALSLMRFGQVAPSGEMLAAASPADALGFARTKALGSPARLSAAEAATRLGGMDGAELAKIYQAFPGDGVDAGLYARAASGDRGAFQQALGSAMPISAQSVLAEARVGTEAPNRAAAMAAVRGGRFTAAARYLEAEKASGGFVALVRDEVPPSDDDPPELPILRGTDKARALADQLGQALAEVGYPAEPALGTRFESAANGGRAAEAACRILIAFGGAPTSEVPPAELVAAVRALALLGLAHPARDLALDAIAARLGAHG